jgi:hypothetical protein
MDIKDEYCRVKDTLIEIFTTKKYSYDTWTKYNNALKKDGHSRMSVAYHGCDNPTYKKLSDNTLLYPRRSIIREINDLTIDNTNTHLLNAIAKDFT